MSFYSSRNKKRLFQSSDDADNSFVKTVTKKYRVCCQPASPSGSAVLVVQTPMALQQQLMQQTHRQRMKQRRVPLQLNRLLNACDTILQETTTTVETTEQPYNQTQTPSRKNTYTRDTNYISTSHRSPNEEPTNERGENDISMFPSTSHTVSTSGNSNTSVAAKRKSLFDTSSNIDISKPALIKASLEIDDDPKRPCFKPSLLGSPFYPGRTAYGGAASHYINQPNIKQKKAALVNQSTNNESTTMSHSARRVMDLLEHYSTPLKEAHRIPATCTWNSKNNTMNSTLETTNSTNRPISYKTQELHVPAIASILRLKKRSRLIDTTNAARQIIASHSSATNYPAYQLNPPDSQRDRTGTDNSKKITTKIKSRLTKPKGRERDELDNSIVPPVNLPKAVLHIDHDNMPKFTFGASTPKPSAISAPKLSLPTRPETINLESTKSNAIIKPTENKISKPETVSNSSSFKFSSPVRISTELPQPSSTLPKFTFGNPERGIDKSTIHEKKTNDPSILGTSKEKDKSDTDKVKNWQCPDCWVFNKTDVDKCVCCGGKKPGKVEGKQNKCTICKLADKQSNKDKCINCEKVQTNSVNNLPLMKSQNLLKQKCPDCWVDNEPNVEKCVCCGGKLSKQASQEPPKVISNSNNSLKWKCNDCWVDNEKDVEKCVCCGAQNSKKPAAPALPLSSTMKDNDWTCDDCWIKNKSSVDKCAACGGAKPGVKKSSAPTLASGALTSSLFTPQDKSLSNVVKTQSDKWECSSCLVRNDNEKYKCVCCESERPGSVKEPAKKSYNFGMNTNTTFKFGIDPKAQEANVTKQQETKVVETKNKTEESETNNNVLSKTPTFTFGLPAKKPELQMDNVKDKSKPNEEKANEAPKLSFSFGIPAAATSATTAAPVFGNLSKLSESSPQKIAEKEKPQEVPKVEFNLPTKIAEKPVATAIFGSPLNTKDSADKSSVLIPPVLNSVVQEEKKEIPSTTLTLQQSVTSSERTPTQNKFSFSTSGIKPAANLFAQSASTATTTNTSFTSPLQTNSVTSAPSLLHRLEPSTAAPTTITLFQKNDQQASPSVSLFQKPEPVSTSAPPTLAATAPLFSFGSSSKPSTSQPDKSKYSFNFGSGSNMNESNSFKFKIPTFGAAAENASPNKFNLSGGTSIGANNPLSSPLGSGNGLSAGSSLANSTLTGGNGLPTASLAVNSKPAGNSLPNELQSGETLQAGAPSLFGAPVQKENMWSSTNNTASNLFTANATSNSIQKPAAFTFGSSSPFNANSSVAPAPAFGSNAQPAQNLFGIAGQTANNQQSLFSTPTKPAPSIFGSPQVSSNPAPAMGMFGTPNVGAAPTFGTPNPSIPSFEAPSLTPAPAPTFNFGSQQTTGIFGFGQQQQQQQPPQQPPLQQTGIYSFGATTGGAPQVQFNMGSSPNAGVRRVRKAVRRNPQR
ncbi:uncharacterized protein ACR2FA_006743 [Aphomia sociella]